MSKRAEEKRKCVYDFIVQYKTMHGGNSPSYSDISEACGIASRSHVQKILHRLRERKLITWEETSDGNIQPRSIVVYGYHYGDNL